MAALDNFESYLAGLSNVEYVNREDTGAYCAMFTVRFTPEFGTLMRLVSYDPHRNFLWQESIALRDVGKEWYLFLEHLWEYAESIRVSYEILNSAVKTINWPGYAPAPMLILNSEPIVIIKACDNGYYFDNLPQ